MSNTFGRAVVAALLGAVLFVATNFIFIHVFRLYFLRSFFFWWVIFSVVVWFVLRAKLPPTTRPNSGADGKRDPLIISTSGNWTVIDAQPAKAPKELTFRGWLIGAIITPFLSYAVMAKTGFPSNETDGFIEWFLIGVVMWFVLGTLLVRWMKSLGSKPRQIQAAPFAVSSEGVRLPNGHVIPANEVYALTIRNGSNQVVGSTPRMFVGGYGAAGAIAVAGASMHAGIQQANVVLQAKIAVIAFRVEVEHGGTSSVLAGGLTDAMAHAVRSEAINRLPGFK